MTTKHDAYLRELVRLREELGLGTSQSEYDDFKAEHTNSLKSQVRTLEFMLEVKTYGGPLMAGDERIKRFEA